MPPYVDDLPKDMEGDVKATLELRQLTHVTWHLEVLKDRIWLSDPPPRPPHGHGLAPLVLNGLGGHTHWIAPF